MKWLIPVLLFCSSCTGEATITSIDSVDVQKWDPVGQCYASMTPSASRPLLGLTDLCPESTSPRVIAGVDRLRLVIDYGEDVAIEPTTKLTAPDVVMTLDGAPLTFTGSTIEQKRIGERAWFLSVITTPLQVGSLRLHVKAATGFEHFVDQVFTIDPLTFTVSVIGCTNDGPCEMAGAVGAAPVEVEVPGNAPHEVTLRSLVDGVPLEAVATVDTIASSSGTYGLKFLQVPAAMDGSTWVIEATLDNAQPVKAQSTPVLLRAPLISAKLACGTPCEMVVGSSTPLTVGAPAQIRTTHAILTATIDGQPVYTDVQIHLTQPDIANDQIEGTFAIVAPSSEGVFELNISVAGYRAQTIVARVVAAP